MKYDVNYSYLEDEIIKDSKSRFDFRKVKEEADKNKMELTEEDFEIMKEVNKWTITSD